MIANYRFLGVDSDTLSTVYKIEPKSTLAKPSLPRAIKQSFSAFKNPHHCLARAKLPAWVRRSFAAIVVQQRLKKTITGCF